MWNHRQAPGVIQDVIGDPLIGRIHDLVQRPRRSMEPVDVFGVIGFGEALQTQTDDDEREKCSLHRLPLKSCLHRPFIRELQDSKRVRFKNRAERRFAVKKTSGFRGCSLFC
jgi:hypothetical protein